jgi:hypothetical protein
MWIVEPFNATHSGHAAPPKYTATPWHAALLLHTAPPYVCCSPWHAAPPAHTVPFWACWCSLGLRSPCGRSPVRPISFKAVIFARHHFNFQKKGEGSAGGGHAAPTWHVALPGHAVPFWTCWCPLGLLLHLWKASS